MKRSRTRLSVTTLVALTQVLVTLPLRADPSARDRAAAEAIFQQASELMDQKKYSEACEKFAASQELDPGIGTLLYLADCYDKDVKTASAWALFREVEQRSQRAGQVDREKIASERAAAVEGKLSRLEVRVPPSRQLPDLELRIGGTVLPRASWNAALPVDPGPATLEARAPGKQTWSTQLTVADGPSTQAIEVPLLRDAPQPRPAPTAATSASLPPTVSSTQKSVGWLMSGVGVAALAASGVFAYRAHSQDQDSKQACRAEDPNACTRDGFEQRQSAKSSANVATVAAISGAALTVGGVALILTAPSATPGASTQGRVLPGAAPTLTSWQVGLRGVW